MSAIMIKRKIAQEILKQEILKQVSQASAKSEPRNEARSEVLKNDVLKNDVLKNDVLKTEVRRELRREELRSTRADVQDTACVAVCGENYGKAVTEGRCAEIADSQFDGAITNAVQEDEVVVEGSIGLYTHAGRADAQEREVALARLLDVLEAGAPEYVQEHADNALECGVHLSQLARLRAAHASYALATSTRMRRVGYGAWLRERYV